MIIPERILEHIKLNMHNQQNLGKRSFYLYDTSIMSTKIDLLKSILPMSDSHSSLQKNKHGVKIFYAMKANPHPLFLQKALMAGVEGIEIASLGEGKIAMRSGFKAKQIIFTGPGKSPEELQWCIDEGIRTVHIESLAEAYRLNTIANKSGVVQDILIRINANFDIHDAQANFSGGSKKLGIDEEKLIAYLPQILALKNLKFCGLHVYAASGVLNVDDLLTNCRLVFNLTKQIETHFSSSNIKCDIIDFGGGFGIDYLQSGKDFSPYEYADKLKSLIAEFGYDDRDFILELGRYLTADSGWYCTEILDIKDSRGIKQVITAGGTNHFRRPAALSINHPVNIIEQNKQYIFAQQEFVSDENVFIGGPLCNTADKIANNIYINKANIGDIAVFCLAGAYGLSMSHTGFLSHAIPDEIFV
jgi:diaminopimelate decarboxylase